MNLNRDSKWQLNPGSSMVERQARDLEVQVRVLVQVQIFLLKFDNLKYIGINTSNRVDSAQDGDYWRALMTVALNLRVP